MDLRKTMLDKIVNTNSETVLQSQNLDRIGAVGTTNPFEKSDKSFFVDESQISNAAMEKYEHELDVQRFSEILKETDEKEANELVLQQAFDGILSIDDDEFMSELLASEVFLNDIA